MKLGLISVIFGLFASLLPAQVAIRIEVQVIDSNRQPVSGASVDVATGERSVRVLQTDDLGRAIFGNLKPGVYTVTASKPGFEAITKAGLELNAAGTTAVEITIIPAVARTDSVEVRGTVIAVEENASRPNTLPPNQARELPSRPATVADALPLTPGVVREPGGGLVLSSSPEHRAALIVNSADVTDPSTGNFGLTVPIDSVEVLNVYQTAYMAEYGRFTAGLVSVETRRGGDKWKWELNDPLPEFRIRSWQLRGLKTATPRLNFEGPIVPNKLFVSEGFEYEIQKTGVYTLPFPFNQRKQQGLNSFTQFDWLASARHIVTGTIHLAPQRTSSVGIDFYTPQAVAPDSSAKNYTGTIFDRYAIGGGLLENRFSVTEFDGSVWGRGTSDMVLAPLGNRGSYFAEQARAAHRTSGASSFQFRPIERAGTHQFKVGGYAAGSEQSGDVRRRSIDILSLDGVRLRRITFPAVRNYEISDIEKSFFAQDHWILTPRLAIDLGIRTESQQISGSFRVGPRTGFSFVPSNRLKTVVRGGFGYFYERVPLNVYAFNRYPGRRVTDYDPEGNVIASEVYLNTLGQSRVRSPFVSQQPIDGNFSPRATIASIQIEQPITSKIRLRTTYLDNRGSGLVILNVVRPEGDSNGAYLLEGTGTSHYRQFDIVAQWKLRDDRQMFFSYVHSRARGDLNDFGRYLGTVPVPIVRPNYYATLNTDLPNRFIAWGVFKLPLKTQIAPVAEFRNGFPYSALNEKQDYAGIPNSRRYPDFLSLDSRFSKDIQLNPKYAVRLSVSAFNLTNHFNPEAVRYNTADPAFGYFFGHRGRRFTVDFDFLF